MSEKDALVNAGIQFAIEGTRALILINGGAAAGLATFVTSAAGNGFRVETLLTAMLLFAFGTLSGTATFGASYIAQAYAVEMNAYRGSPQASTFNWLRGMALGCAILSCVLFVIGIVLVSNSYAPPSNL